MTVEVKPVWSRRWCGRSRLVGSLRKEIQALETAEKVIAVLALSPERDEVISRLIAAIEDDRAALLAAMIGVRPRDREPKRLRREVGNS
jgi:hypothetical protein